MGCTKSQEAPQGTLLEQYCAANLRQPDSGDYENEFEKQIYMAINLCRFDPKRMVPHVRKVYRENILLSAGKGLKMTELIAKLQAQTQLTQVRFDGEANDACRQNNKDLIEKDEEVPTLGGNIAKYSEISGGDKSSSCTEYTMVKYQGSTGEDFVALQLALDFEDFKGVNAANPDAVAAQPEAAAADAAANAEPAASSEPDAAAVANTLDYGGVANPVDASTAPAATGEEEAKKPADAADAKKPAGEPTKPSYSPILDEAVTSVGICNKAHKKTINIIQVLYCKASTNAMM